MSQNISNMHLNPYQQYNQQQNANFSASSNAATQASNNIIVQNNPILNAATKENTNPGVLLGTGIASALALFNLNDLINKPLQTKKYNDTFFKKIEENIDKRTKGPKSQAFLNKLSSLENAIKAKAQKSEILRTLFTKPSIGGSVAQPQAEGSKGHLANRAIEIMKKYKKANPGFTEFDTILSKAEKESYKHYDEIMRTISNSSADLTKVMEKRTPWSLGLIKNKASLQEILNKDILIQNYKSSGKSLGQKVAGYLMRSAECVTNGIFGGKGQILMQAAIIAMSANEASKAEKGEKFSSFMASFMEQMAFLATMGIQMRIVNNIAGLKHMGMTKANVDKLHDAIKLAKTAAKNNDIVEYTKQLDIINKLKNVTKSNTVGNSAIKWYQKPFKWIGNIASYGRINETVTPLKFNKFSTSLAKIPYGIKIGVGYAGRIALLMGVVIPIFSGIAKRISYSIFGKPVKTIEREKQAEKEEKAQQEAQAENKTQPTNVQQPQNQTQPQKAGSLYEQLNNKYQNKPQTPIGAQTMNPAAASVESKKTPEETAGIKRTYIPSPILGQENIIAPASSRSSEIDAIMRQADIAEAQAQRYL